MAPRYRLLVFDWDGTLIDSTGAIAAALQAAVEDLGHERPSDASASHVIGLGLKDALRYVAPALPESEYTRLVERYRVHFLAADAHTIPFAGVVEGLSALVDSGCLLAIATGKSRRGLERALDQTGLRRYFVASRCADEGHSKPHPGMLLAVMESLGMAPADTLMIGDTSHDLAMAKSAGVRAAAVSYGAHPRAELLALEPEACLESAAALFTWLAQRT